MNRWFRTLTTIAVAAAPHVVLSIASAAALYPVLWVVKLALTPGESIDTSLSLVPAEGFSGEHFARIVGEADRQGRPLFLHQFWNSIVVSSASTVVGLSLSCSAAYAFARFRFAAREAGLRALLLTQMFPGVLSMVALYRLMDVLGLLDSLAGLVLVYSAGSVPFCTWMLKGYFETIPREIEEAAAVDGASRALTFRRVVLPMSRPALAVTALFSFMSAWNEFVLAATFLGDPALFTLPVALQRHVGEFRTDWGAFGAGAIITSAPIMALFYLLQKHMVSGLTAGGVKG